MPARGVRWPPARAAVRAPRGPRHGPCRRGVDLVHAVDPQRLDPEPAGGVEHHVEREHLAVPELPLAVGPNQHPGDPEVPDQLVTEGGVEGGELLVPARSVPLIDPQAPWQRGRATDSSWLNQLPIRPIACATTRPERRHRQSRSADLLRGATGMHQPPRGDRAPDAESACPDLQRVDWVLAGTEVEFGVGDHVVDLGPDAAAGTAPRSPAPERPGLPLWARQRRLAGDHAGDDPGEDAQGVRASGKPKASHTPLAGLGMKRGVRMFRLLMAGPPPRSSW